MKLELNIGRSVPEETTISPDDGKAFEGGLPVKWWEVSLLMRNGFHSRNLLFETTYTEVRVSCRWLAALSEQTQIIKTLDNRTRQKMTEYDEDIESTMSCRYHKNTCINK